MYYKNDAPYADIFECNGEFDFHDYYYISPMPYEEDAPFYKIHRTGIESRSPSVFFVERSCSTLYCEIFCIFTGKGELIFRGKKYELGAGQIVLLPEKEGHSYRSDSKDPLGMAWIEFYGGDSKIIMEHLLEHKEPIWEGGVFKEISRELSLLQQRMMLNEEYDPSIELYGILFHLQKYLEIEETETLTEKFGDNFKRLEHYLDAHIYENISNQQMAKYCGLSLSCFTKHFKACYRMAPQRYLMKKKIGKARQLLLQSNESIEKISEMMGFCNTSHFIRRFQQIEHMSPNHYRRQYKIADM